MSRIKTLIVCITLKALMLVATPIWAENEIILKQYDEVNSFHEYGSIKTNKNFITLAISNDGIIEAVKHIDREIYGIMWHPERENPFNKLDKLFLKMIFGG